MKELAEKLISTIGYFTLFSKQAYSILGIYDWLKLVLNFFLRVRYGTYTINYHGLPLTIRRGTQDIFVFLNVFANRSHRPLEELSPV